MEYRSMNQKSALDRVLIRFVKTRLGRKLFTTVFSSIDARLMPLTKGRSLAVGQPVCLIHTRGARTGKPRRTPLLYTPRGEEIVVAASKAGAERHPAWYYNLKAHPEVEVQIGDTVRPMVAREAEGAERDQLWRLINDHFSGYEDYQRIITRRIPVLVLSPRRNRP